MFVWSPKKSLNKVDEALELGEEVMKCGRVWVRAARSSVKIRK